MRRSAALAALALLVGTAGSAHGHAGDVPPYRALGSSPVPAAGSAQVSAVAGWSTAAVVATQESAPQASVVLPVRAAQARGGLVLSAVPVLPPQPPRGARILGHAYSLRLVDTAGRDVPLTIPARVQLRTPEGEERRVALHRHDGRSWQPLPTDERQPHLHMANLPALGTVAALSLPDRLAAPAATATGTAPVVPVVLALGGALALLLVSTAILRRRPRLHPTPGSST